MEITNVKIYRARQVGPVIWKLQMLKFIEQDK